MRLRNRRRLANRGGLATAQNQCDVFEVPATGIHRLTLRRPNTSTWASLRRNRSRALGQPLLFLGSESHRRMGMAPGASRVPHRVQVGQATRTGMIVMPRPVRIVRDWLCRVLLIEIRAESQARKTLRKRVQESEKDNKKKARQLSQVASGLDDAAIRRRQDAAELRLQSIEGKAKANLAGITIAVAVLFAGLNLVVGGGLQSIVAMWVSVTGLVGIVVSVGYMLLGGCYALRALKVGEFYEPTIEQEAKKKKDRAQWAMAAVFALRQNEKLVLMRTNALSVSFGGIRNGVFCLGCVVVLLAVGFFFSGPDSPHSDQPDGEASSLDAGSLKGAESTPDGPVPSSPVDDSVALPESLDSLSSGDTEAASPDTMIRGVPDAVHVRQPGIEQEATIGGSA